MTDLIIIGGGLAGSEAAWQAGNLGIKVDLFEMRPSKWTGAHTTTLLSELVCSNSLGSRLPNRASGMLKDELRRMGSLLLLCAEQSSVPAGGALAVDREGFASKVTNAINTHPNINVIREEITTIPNQPTIIATGPLTSPKLADAISKLSGESHLFFFDAIAPIVTKESINFEIAFRGSRYGRGDQLEGDYINCPLDEPQYIRFVEALLEAQRIDLHDFERRLEQGVRSGPGNFFEGCLPIEVLARRGILSLAFGPMRPVGLVDVHSGKRPYAVVQLRQDNLAGSLYNMVGFQTNLMYAEQKRIFRLIPGLERAEFVRYGQMHRNTFINSPVLLEPTLQFRRRKDLFFAGQITGVEGYAGNIATGLLAGWNAAKMIRGEKVITMPATTQIGALCRYISSAAEADFQPMKSNFGILPALEGPKIKDKKQRLKAYVQRGMHDLEKLMETAVLSTTGKSA